MLTTPIVCRDGDNLSLSLTSSFERFFGEGAMRQKRGCLGNTSIFLQFVNDSQGTPD
ncbi:hypothetical protein Syncc8109_1088 [Synechococcus sp. WH 8109]|nr:hypothetical protein Syncc8109_1088 [Synechococcus sp. WH 8109]